ncbi:MAG: carboxypeptidase regulatory-like domain-containing protein [bacterium]|nr:carboxypeptidase regulatory-like domain-containing protein [bacterium]
MKQLAIACLVVVLIALALLRPWGSSQVVNLAAPTPVPSDFTDHGEQAVAREAASGSASAAIGANSDSIASSQPTSRRGIDPDVPREPASAFGRVLSVPEAASSNKLTVQVLADRASNESLAACAVDSDGRWEIAALPATDTGRLTFRLEGTGVPMELDRESPPPGQRIEVDFEFQAGHVVRCHTIDEEREAQADVRVVAKWETKEGWVRLSARTGPDGHAAFDACPKADIWIYAYSDVFADEVFGPFAIPDFGDEVPIELRLSRAGRITGRCLLAGDPVEDFTVTWAREFSDQGTETSERPQDVEFHGRADGEFELTDVPSGRVWLIATSGALAPGPTAQVVVPAGGTENVELELVRPVLGSGRVTDALTLEPVSDARIQVHFAHDGRARRAFGPPVRVRSDGRFDALPLVPGANRLEVTATGHADDWTAIVGETEGARELAITLFRRQSLTVRLVARTAIDFTGYRVGNTSVASMSHRAVDANGIVRFEDTGSGGMRIEVMDPQGGRTDVYVRLGPGKDERLDVLVDAGRRVIARLVPPPGETLPDKLWIAATSSLADGEDQKTFRKPDATGAATFESIAGTFAVFQVFHSDGRRLGNYWRELAADNIVELELPFSPESRRLQVFDAAGQPVANARADFRAPGDRTDYVLAWLVDSDGIIDLVGVEASKLEVRIYQSGVFSSRTRTVDLESAEDPIRIDIDPSADMQLRLTERGVPAAGLDVVVTESPTDVFIRFATSNSVGNVAVARVEHGAYICEVRHPAYWPSRHEVTATVGGPEQALEVRQLGAAEVRVMRAGAPVAGARIVLRSVEFGVPVADWVAEERARVEPASWTSDASGRVNIQAIPNGRYTWAVTFPDGFERAGEMLVAPARVSVAEVRRP